MKRFLTAVVAAFFLLTTVAHAATVPLYDHGVDDILNAIRFKSNFNVEIRGTHYYTGTDGFRYCASQFGLHGDRTDNNSLIFQLNNNGTVSSVCITSYAAPKEKEEYNYSASVSTGTSLVSIYNVIGMSPAEMDKLITEMGAWDVEYTKTFSVWCAKAKRYIAVKASSDDRDLTIKYFLYAYT